MLKVTLRWKTQNWEKKVLMWKYELGAMDSHMAQIIHKNSQSFFIVWLSKVDQGKSYKSTFFIYWFVSAYTDSIFHVLL